MLSRIRFMRLLRFSDTSLPHDPRCRTQRFAILRPPLLVVALIDSRLLATPYIVVFIRATPAALRLPAAHAHAIFAIPAFDIFRCTDAITPVRFLRPKITPLRHL